MTDRYAVVGNPVAHSLSPRIHEAFAAATGEAMTYERLLAPLDGFAETLEAFFAAGGAGVNVTVPFKQQAASWVRHLDPAALAAGAVNTIVADGGAYRGYNTDGAGLVRDLTVNCHLDLAGLRILLLGAGGAARGVLRPLLDLRPERLLIVNRTAARATALAGAATSPVASGGGLEAAAGAFDVVINATSAGLGGAVAQIPADAVRDAFCYDMVYAAPTAGASAPEETAFCRWAKEHGARQTSDGLGMLVEQAGLAFELWRGRAPDTKRVLRMLRGGGGANPRRFVAGAVCPQCRAMDRIVIERGDGGQRRYCVACGYADTMPGGASQEPATRLTRQGDSDTEATPLRILDRSKPKS